MKIPVIPISLITFSVFFTLIGFGDSKNPGDPPSLEELGIQRPVNQDVFEDPAIREKVKIEIVPRRVQTAPCEPVIIDITATNVSNEIVTGQETNDYNDFILEVTTFQAQTVPLTAYGKQMNKQSIIHRYIIRDLNPSECMTGTLLVNRVYDMTMEGKYSIRVKSTFKQHRDEKHAYCDVWSVPVAVDIDDDLIASGD